MFNRKVKRITLLERENERLRKQLEDLSKTKTRTVRFYKCCEDCINNPKNNPNASGVCNCTLPYLEEQRIRYQSTMEL